MCMVQIDAWIWINIAEGFTVTLKNNKVAF
jgi:hypothetical protein